MRLQGAIFDMDGTLLDSMPVWATLGSNFLQELGKAPETGLDTKLKSMSLRQAAEYCKTTYDLQQTIDEIVKLVDDRVDQFYREEVTIKPDVDKFLSLLKMQGVWMYVATATDRTQAEAALRHTGLDGYFRGILTCSEVGQGKDQPLIFEKCLTRLRCQKADCVVFEDSLHAVKTAKSADFRVAAVYDAFSEADQPEILSLADYEIHSYREFLQSAAQ